MEKCVICGKPLIEEGGASEVVKVDGAYVHYSCGYKVIAKYIADQEAARAKEPTLEDRIESHLIEAWGMGANRPHVDTIIAMVREHDAANRFYPFGGREEADAIELSPIEEKIRSFMHSTCRPLPEVIREVVKMARSYADTGETWEQVAKNWEIAFGEMRKRAVAAEGKIAAALADLAT